MVSQRLAAVGALLADQTRAALLSILLDGRAFTGGELARAVGVAPSTASGHLSKLIDGGMVAVEPCGRHRYFRLASADVATLLETIKARAPVAVAPAPPRVPAALAYARTCYDHLAGEVAVRLHAHLVDTGRLSVVDDHPVVTPSGQATLAGLGIDCGALMRGSRPLIRHCLDWTERRHHIAGAVGAALLAAMVERSWVKPGVQPRVLRITSAGRHGLAEHLGLRLG
jgi:DNA-binding transcriptional ArsR family regulator